MPAGDKYTVETITAIRRWTPKLFSFHTTRDRGFRFVPGQFARLGIPVDTDRIVWRAYSMASADYDEHLEFYSIVVPDGEFTTRLARLAVGDSLLVEKTNYGFLTTDRFESGGDLWMLATGTGLAPFLSILHDPATWERYANLVLVHCVRHADELAYRERIDDLRKHPLIGEAAGKLRYLPVVTRETIPGVLDARITTLVEDGRLQAAAGLPLDPQHSRIMVCGNPEMVEDTRKILGSRGFAVSRRGKPGQMAFENYW